MPSLQVSRVKRADLVPPNHNVSKPELLNITDSPIETTTDSGLRAVDTTGADIPQKHIFGNKTYHLSHGRTTPFPEPGISMLFGVLPRNTHIYSTPYMATQHPT